MIAMNQFAFVQKRLLMENVLLATEVVKDYHKQNISPRCMMKIDFSKAFDSVRWSFLLMVLKVMRVPPKFVQWVELCITMPSFSIQVNGELAGYFNSSRGLRQGCSLSPYLFVICMNVLSKLLDKGAKDRLFSYHPRCKVVKLTHLCFADDLLVFVEGCRESIEGVVAILDKFSRMSGLVANLEKSSLFMAGISPETRLSLRSSFPFTEGSLPVRYLGLPLVTKRLMKEDYMVLVECIRARFNSWTCRFLSYAGRVQLVSSVIYSIINFWQSAFHLPAACLRDLGALCAAFIWDGPTLNNNRVKVAWELLCLPKNEGGLGLRLFKEVNRIGSLKLIWRIVSRSSSLWVRWVSSYLLKDHSFWQVKASTIGTWRYKKLLKLRDVAKNMHRVEIRSGRGTSFWYDVWSEKGCLWDLVGTRGVIDFGIPLSASVADVISTTRTRRHRQALYRTIEELISLISQRAQSIEDDIHLWRRSGDVFSSDFSSAHTWKHLRTPMQRVPWYRLVWFAKATPKFAFIAWMACLDRLSTLDHVFRWNTMVDTRCVLCNVGEETKVHLFFGCPYSEYVWKGLIGRFMGSDYTSNWESLLQLLCVASLGRTRSFLVRYSFQATMYFLWQERNGRRHGNQPVPANMMVRMVEKGVRNKLSAMQKENATGFRDGMQLWLSTH